MKEYFKNKLQKSMSNEKIKIIRYGNENKIYL